MVQHFGDLRELVIVQVIAVAFRESPQHAQILESKIFPQTEEARVGAGVAAWLKVPIGGMSGLIDPVVLDDVILEGQVLSHPTWCPEDSGRVLAVTELRVLIGNDLEDVPELLLVGCCANDVGLFVEPQVNRLGS
jgi:hypothetical protein